MKLGTIFSNFGLLTSEFLLMLITGILSNYTRSHDKTYYDDHRYIFCVFFLIQIPNLVILAITNSINTNFVIKIL